MTPRQRGVAIALGASLVALFECGSEAVRLHGLELFDNNEYLMASSLRSFGAFELGHYQVEPRANLEARHFDRPWAMWAGGLPTTSGYIETELNAYRGEHRVEARTYSPDLHQWRWMELTKTHDAARDAAHQLAALRFESCVDSEHTRLAYRFVGEGESPSGWYVVAALEHALVLDRIEGARSCAAAIAAREGTDWIARDVARGYPEAIELASVNSFALSDAIDATIAHEVVWDGDIWEHPRWQDRLPQALAWGSSRLARSVFDAVARETDAAPGPRGTMRLDEWVGVLIDAIPDEAAKLAFARRMQASCETDFAPCAAPYRVRATARAARSDPALCDALLGWMPRVLATRRDDTAISGVALFQDLRECSSAEARRAAALAVLSAEEPYPPEPNPPERDRFDACVGRIGETPPQVLAECSSLAVLATWEFAEPCDASIVELARRLEARTDPEWMYASLDLLSHCGARDELASYADRLRASRGDYEVYRLVDYISPAQP